MKQMFPPLGLFQAAVGAVAVSGTAIAQQTPMYWNSGRRGGGSQLACVIKLMTLLKKDTVQGDKLLGCKEDRLNGINNFKKGCLNWNMITDTTYRYINGQYTGSELGAHFINFTVISTDIEELSDAYG